MTELDPGIAAMLRREGARVHVPAEAATRVAARLSSSIGAGGSGGTGGSAGAGAGPIALKLAPFLITFVVGAGVGGVVVAAVRTDSVAPATRVASAPSTSASPAAREVPSAAPSSSMATISVDALPSARVLPPTTTASAARATPFADAGVSDVREDTFVAERRVLDTARSALARGDHAGALQALDEHARTYAKGRLEEEREALLVRTLADSGKLEEASARAARFRSRWPNSVLRPAVEAATGDP